MHHYLLIAEGGELSDEDVEVVEVAWVPLGELAQRLEGSGVTANSLHPGVVATQFGQSGNWFMRIGTRIARPFFIGADEGARTSVFLASSPDVEGVSGLYFKDAKPARPSRQARDADAARRLWAVSEELVARSA